MILVTGANGVVGKPLCQRLDEENRAFKRVSRDSTTGDIQWDLNHDLNPNQYQSLKGVTTLIHCAPIWLLNNHIATLHALGIKRMVVFSSTSVLSKQASINAHEQLLVKQLKDGESALTNFNSSNNINDSDCLNYTILRPSMIYGYGRDQNVSHIAKFIKKYHFMVLMGKATGLRQPVHCDDLVTTSIDIINQTHCYSKTYNLAGASVFTYRQMVERIFREMNRKALILNAPLFVFKLSFWLLNKIGRFAYNSEMANRMNQDLCYDYQAAKDDFNYAPQAFLEHAERDLNL